MRKELLFGIASALTLTGSVGFANSTAPSYTTFGTLSAATFGGTGIANTAVAITTAAPNSEDTITLGLSATSVYPNSTTGDALPNNCAGTFYATAGLENSLATWNFDYYIGLIDNSGATYKFTLMEKNNTTGSAHSLTPTTVQNSDNLGVASFGSPIGFNAGLDDQYAFTLCVTEGNSPTIIAEVAINVDVQSAPAPNFDPAPDPVPDATSSALLLVAAMGGLMALRSKRNPVQMAH